MAAFCLTRVNVKRCIAILLLLLPALSQSATIECYSAGKKIYSGKIHDVVFDEDIVFFVEPSTGKMIMIHGDCIAKVTQEEIEAANNAARVGD